MTVLRFRRFFYCVRPLATVELGKLKYWALSTGTGTFELWPPANPDLDSNLYPNHCADRVQAPTKPKIPPRPWFKAAGTMH